MAFFNAARITTGAFFICVRNNDPAAGYKRNHCRIGTGSNHLRLSGIGEHKRFRSASAPGGCSSKIVVPVGKKSWDWLEKGHVTGSGVKATGGGLQPVQKESWFQERSWEKDLLDKRCWASWRKVSEAAGQTYFDRLYDDRRHVLKGLWATW